MEAGTDRAPIDGGAPPVRPPHRRRRSPLKIAVAVVLVVAAIGAAAWAVGARHDDDPAPNDTTASGALRTANDARAKAVLTYCDDPRPLTSPKGVAAFRPGRPAVAYVVVPQPASVTTERSDRVVQVSPRVGKPNLDLDASIGLVSLAVCIEERSTKPTGGTCDYTLTNPSSLGDEATRKLATTTFDVTIYALTTGKAIVKDTMTTSDEACPEYAYTDAAGGVSNPVTDALLLSWLAEHLPEGKPA